MWTKVLDDFFIYLSNSENYYLHSYYKPLVLIDSRIISGETHSLFIPQNLPVE